MTLNEGHIVSNPPEIGKQLSELGGGGGGPLHVFMCIILYACRQAAAHPKGHPAHAMLYASHKSYTPIIEQN